MFVQSSDDITLIRVDDGEMSEEQIAQIEQAASDASSALTTATQAKKEAEDTSEALEVLEADVINGKYINAEKIVTQGLQAGTAAIKNAVVGNIDAGSIVTQGLQTGTAQIKQAVVDNLDVGSINGNVIKNSAVLAKALSNEMVETVLGVKVFYASEAPTAEKGGDIWYKTIAGKDFDPLTDVVAVWDGEKWVDTDFSTPDSIFMANSIIAQDINANQVTSNSAFMDLLQTRIAYIGDRTSRHARINEDGLHVFSQGDVEGHNEIAHIGFGELPWGESTILAAYYTFGSRRNKIGYYSFAEGEFVEASGMNSHGEGNETIASGNYSHAEGHSTKASGYSSHAEGYGTNATGDYSHASGFSTYADGDYMTAVGKHNTKDSGKAFVVGNGESFTARSDAFSVDWDGNITVQNHTSPIGTYKSTYLSANKALRNTWASIVSITIEPGTWLVGARAQTTGTQSTSTNMYINISSTAAHAFNEVPVQYTASVGAMGANIVKPWVVTANTTLYLNAYSSQSCTLGTNTNIWAVRLV